MDVLLPKSKAFLNNREGLLPAAESSLENKKSTTQVTGSGELGYLHLVGKNILSQTLAKEGCGRDVERAQGKGSCGYSIREDTEKAGEGRAEEKGEVIERTPWDPLGMKKMGERKRSHIFNSQRSSSGRRHFFPSGSQRMGGKYCQGRMGKAHGRSVNYKMALAENLCQRLNNKGI